MGALLLAGAFAAGAAAPALADDVFLRLDGVRGESVDAKHKAEIEILSYTQSFTGPFARSAAGTAAAASKTICGPVTITKFIDAASPDLLLNVANGKHIPTAVFTFRRPGGANQLEYYKVMLDDVLITEIEQSDTKSGRATEKVSLIGRRYRFEYVLQGPDGRIVGTPKAGWDCVANSKV
jgi:type VI secretion system secreted protein Hcp